MAKESKELPVTPELTKPSKGETRRFSAGKLSSGNSDEKIVPNYLRASTGSCHDFCKYGKKHAVEAKERRSIPDRATRKQLAQSSEKRNGGIMTSVSGLRRSFDSKLTKVSISKLGGESIDSECRSSELSGTSKSRLSTKSFDSEKQKGNKDLANMKKTTLAKFKSPILLKSLSSPTMRRGIPSTSKGVESLSRLSSKKVEIPSESSSKAKTSSKSPSKVKTLSKSIPKTVETSSVSSSLKGKEMRLSEKHATSLSPITYASRKTVSSTTSSKGFSGQRNTETKNSKGSSSSNFKAASRKLIAPIGVPVSPRPSLKRIASLNSRKHKGLKIVSHLKNQPEPEEHNNNEVVEEKTLYVVTIGNEEKNLQSDQNASYDDESSLAPLSSPLKFSPPSTSQSLSQEDLEESEYTSSEFEDESTENGESLEVEARGKPRKDRISCSEDKDSEMFKLKFRRGKVIENQIERNTPRRLKFRRVKLLGEKANIKGGAQRKSFELGGGDEINGDEAATGPEKVVLRHQGMQMQDKKDAQGLFNNVIEETASKLVETRKSKVKALVGAFETVISLQEKKPTANTLS